MHNRLLPKEINYFYFIHLIPVLFLYQLFYYLGFRLADGFSIGFFTLSILSFFISFFYGRSKHVCFDKSVSVIKLIISSCICLLVVLFALQEIRIESEELAQESRFIVICLLAGINTSVHALIDSFRKKKVEWL